jgi:hypothetical protein
MSLDGIMAGETVQVGETALIAAGDHEIRIRLEDD